MPLDRQTLEQINLELAGAQGNYASGQMDQEIGKDAKLIAAAIAMAGARIAQAVAAIPADA